MAFCDLLELVSRLSNHPLQVWFCKLVSCVYLQVRLASTLHTVSCIHWIFSHFYYDPNRSIGSLHKAVFSNYGWHISIIIAMFVNTKHHYFQVVRTEDTPNGAEGGQKRERRRKRGFDVGPGEGT